MSYYNIKNPFDSDDESEAASFQTKPAENDFKAIPEPERKEACSPAVPKEEDAWEECSAGKHQPDGEMKLFCQCASCQHWTNSVDWCPTASLQFGKAQKKSAPRQKIFQPFTRSETHPGKTPKIHSYNAGYLTKTEIDAAFKTLVHGPTIPQPVKLCTEAFFSADIQSSLQSLNYKFTLPVQAFAWPAIFRQMNVIMIGGRKSGKTFAYLPAVCSFSTSSDEKYKELSKHKGPLVIILCSSSKQCEEVLDLITKIYQNVAAKPKVTIMTYPLTNIKSTDILITIPDSLTACLKSRMFNLKRLCHFVLEDTSNLLKLFQDTIHKVFDVVNEMLEHRANNAQVQLIATSEKWTSSLKRFAERLYRTPLICISDDLEAALYGNIQFQVKSFNSEDEMWKMRYLHGLLKNDCNVTKTVVVCDESEITNLEHWLKQNAIKTIALRDDVTKERVEAFEMEWAVTQSGDFKVLLCTDFVFDSLLHINDAMWLVHYSLPATWTRFTKRFSALVANFKSPLDKTENLNKTKSFILMDATCGEQMPKILHLFERLSKDVTQQKWADTFRKSWELAKIKARVEICPTLKLFGKCSNSVCEKRHLLDESDVSKDLPRFGRVRFRILNMKDVNQFTVQLVEHIDLNDTVWRLNDADLKEAVIFDEKEGKKSAEKLEIGRFYAHCESTVSGEEFHLCHVLKVQKNSVEVKLVSGLVLTTMKSRLFEPPADLTIVDVYLSNLIPPFGDESFSGRSFYVTRASLEKEQYKTVTLTGTVVLQLDQTLWLDNVTETYKVDNVDVVKFNLTKHLRSLEVVEVFKEQITLLHKLCTNCAINLPSYVKQVARKSHAVKEVEPQMAFLHLFDMQEVIFSSAVSPDEFYVRLAKFQPLLEKLEKDIQIEVETEIPSSKIDIELGKYYLALDSRGQSYGRAKILNVEDSKALCYYVDYGDDAIVDVSTIRILPSRFLNRLPFQAIQCRLYGLAAASGQWREEATDVLYKYMFEPESDIFRSLYVEARAKDEADLIRTRTVYSVALKDAFGDEQVLINQLLLDCGLASSMFTKIDDFELPTVEEVEEVSRSDSDGEVIDVEEVDEDLKRILGSDCDFELFDGDEFLQQLFGVAHLDYPELPIEPKKEKKFEYKPMIASDPAQEKSDGLTPEVYWSQSESTVKLKIKLIGVESYKVSVVRRNLFRFWTRLDEKMYELKFVLNKAVELERHYAGGQEVVVHLKKLEPVEWMQLTGGSRRLRNVHYEVSDAEVAETKRRFLQLDITDDESDEDGPMVHDIGSGLDSDLDVSLGSDEGFDL